MAGVTRSRSITFVSARSTTTRTGTSNSTLIYQEATITLTAGTWVVTAGGGVLNLTVSDDGVAGIYNRTTSAEVATSRGGTKGTSTTAYAQLISLPVSITVTSDTTFCPIFDRSGASQLRAQSGAASTAAAGYITAFKIA